MERGRLAPWLAVALGAGVLLYFGLAAEPPEAAIWLAPPLLALAIWTAARWPLAGWALGLVAAAALGFAIASWQAGRQPPMPELPRGAAILEARIAAVELLPEGRRLTLDAPRLDGAAPLARQIRIRLKHDDPAKPRPGDLIRVRALVRAPAAPAYPGAWDFQRAAWFSGLAGSGFALGRAELLPGEAGAPLLAGWRAVIEGRVIAAIPGAAGPVAAALLTGGQSAISDCRSRRHAGQRAGASAQRLRPAYRHRYGAQLRAAAAAAGPAALGRAAAAREAGRGAGCARGRWALPVVDRLRGADAAQFRHGGTGDAGPADRAAGA